MGGGGYGSGRGDFREGEGQKPGRGAEEEVEGNGLTAPSPAPSEAVRVGQLGGGRGSAGLIWKPEGRGRAPRQTMGLCVGESVCTLEGGGRRVREKEEGVA